MQNYPVLVTGATGYVGSRLVVRLLQAGYQVRAAARSVTKLQGRPWAKNSNIQLVTLDALNEKSFLEAANGCRAAYYLIHSMNSQQKDFAEADKQAALNMVSAAEQAKLERIIYLSGLGEKSDELSKHLRSRSEVAEILCSGAVSVTVLRAAMIIGSGSASFEILRYLVDRLPAMITPRWVSTPSQPIAIRDVLYYLVACLENEKTKGQSFDIGGPDVITYRQLMELYAQEAGLPKRLIIPVPVFTPKLSSYWIHLVTPVPAYIARPLADGLRNPALCKESTIQSILPHKLLSCREAIHLALVKLKHHEVESHWTDAGYVPQVLATRMMPPPEWDLPDDPSWAGGTEYKDSRSIVADVTLQQAWQAIAEIGGETGWYYADWLWQLRGFIDKLIGGVGLRRGRRHKREIFCGDALDFWRVVYIQPGEKLLLKAEMKLPGEAFLELKVKALSEQQTRIEQTAQFIPKGLLGIIYWKLLLPIHSLIFSGMLAGIAKAAKNI